MTDIAKRMKLIKSHLDNQSSFFPEIYMYEFICLQFRSIAELILLSSLVALQKEYINVKGKITLEYRPKQLNEYLGRVNPDYYQQPQIFHITGEMQFEHMKSGFLTTEDIETIFHLCSNAIHPQHPFKSNEPRTTTETFKDWHSLK